MKIAVLGAGGVGGTFGARLAAAGEDVTFIARGAHLAAIQKNGLKVESPTGDLHLDPAVATDDPASIGPVDIVMFTPKLWDTETAGEAIRPLLGEGTAVISFQNGIDAEDILARVLGRARVMGGVAKIGATIAAPGVVRQMSPFAALEFGELDNKKSPRAESFLAACRGAGIDAEIPDDIHRALWEKFIFLIAFSAMTALTGEPAGAIRGDPAMRARYRRFLEETAAVAAAKGIALGADYVDGQMDFLDALPADGSSSMARDLAQGNRIEVEYLSGTVARLGRELGVKVPENAAAFDALAPRAMGRA